MHVEDAKLIANVHAQAQHRVRVLPGVSLIGNAAVTLRNDVPSRYRTTIHLTGIRHLGNAAAWRVELVVPANRIHRSPPSFTITLGRLM
jgi:hypothetical protein